VVLSTTTMSVVIAGLLGTVPPVVILAIGAVLVLLGILRMFKLLLRLMLNSLGRNDNPVLAGVLMILVGAIAMVVAVVR
jgi:hypothetical protein